MNSHKFSQHELIKLIKIVNRINPNSNDYTNSVSQLVIQINSLKISITTPSTKPKKGKIITKPTKTANFHYP